ncbi:MAG: translation elongation factor Ts [Cyanobacteria bacterium SBLK]|nr:translation elongation factor Ts [Cyanobacteria bacterium SBLK]
MARNKKKKTSKKTGSTPKAASPTPTPETTAPKVEEEAPAAKEEPAPKVEEEAPAAKEEPAPKVEEEAPAAKEESAPKVEKEAPAVEATKTSAKSEPSEPKAKISSKLIKELREKTGAGMMKCKQALIESDGDPEKAAEWLRKKGMISAGKKSGRVTAEGLVGSYIHTGGRVGVLVEVNCETDFVARREEFQELVRNIAMQVAACPNVEYVKVGDVDKEFIEKETAIEMGREDLAKKPENIRAKIVEGRISKRLKEITLLDQPYIKDQSITVEELVKQTIAQLGENIQVRRFSRFVLGEGIEKAESNFAEEVAAQTGQK